jgi:hypothetical protein
MRVSDKNITAGSPRTSESGFCERKISEKEMEVITMEEGEINDVVEEEVVMEDMD